MREILFRGRGVKSGEWQYGDFLQNHYGNSYVFPQNPTCESGFHLEPNYNYKVDRATVGQYTGLTGKNGVRIFEGDIMFDEDMNQRMIVKYGDYDTYAQGIIHGFYADIIGRELPEPEHCMNLKTRAYNAIVVGNIHDNPDKEDSGE